MAKKKTTKGRKKSRPDYAKIAFIVVLCFLSGAFSYGVLDLIFSKKQNFAEVVIEASNSKTDTNSKTKNSQKPKQNDIKDKKSEANFTILTTNTTTNSLNLEQNLTNLENSSNLEQDKEQISNSNLPVKKPFDGTKPKLAIIMDDIIEAGQIEKIKKLPIAVTPSIFPPNAKNKNTPSLSKDFKSFSIHLPLEALNYTDELKTIKTDATYEEIERSVAKLRNDFPNAKFINNHTGSKFTGDENAMNLLIRALFRYDFYFVDSRTIGKTTVKSVVERYHMRYAYRDIFLDNIDSVTEVRIKLKEAVQVAKKKGYAIAIGHPKKATFQALANSSDILGEVEVVYLDEIYGYYK